MKSGGGVVVPVEDAIVCGGEMENVMMVGEDGRDDNGIPFLVLRVRDGRGGEARLYCKKVCSR